MQVKTAEKPQRYKPVTTGPVVTKRARECRSLLEEAQTLLHKIVKAGQLRQLSPFKDEGGIIRVGGRVDQALASYDTRHPVMLPRKHQISYLITQCYHEIGHTGVATTVAKNKRKYWIIRSHDLAKLIRLRCVVCRKFDAKVEEQYMANLPFTTAPVLPHCVRLLRTVPAKNQPEQTCQVLWSNLYLFDHSGCSFGADRRLLDNGVLTDTKTLFLNHRLSCTINERQRIAVSRR